MSENCWQIKKQEERVDALTNPELDTKGGLLAQDNQI